MRCCCRNTIQRTSSWEKLICQILQLIFLCSMTHVMHLLIAWCTPFTSGVIDWCAPCNSHILTHHSVTPLTDNMLQMMHYWVTKMTHIQSMVVWSNGIKWCTRQSHHWFTIREKWCTCGSMTQQWQTSPQASDECITLLQFAFNRLTHWENPMSPFSGFD